MAKHLSKRTMLANKTGMDVSLFPFLSIFLCVMGVLSFLNILNSTVGARKLVMTGEVAQGYKVAYQIFCLPDGMIAVPSVKRLPDLIKQVAKAHKPALEEILQKRQQQREKLAEQQDDLKAAAFSPTEEAITQLFQEIKWLNYQALSANVLYEEFVLFGIYPDSGEVYHKIRQVMYDNEEFLGIRIGLEALDTHWKLATVLQQKKSLP